MQLCLLSAAAGGAYLLILFGLCFGGVAAARRYALRRREERERAYIEEEEEQPAPPARARTAADGLLLCGKKARPQKRRLQRAARDTVPKIRNRMKAARLQTARRCRPLSVSAKRPPRMHEAAMRAAKRPPPVSRYGGTKNGVLRARRAFNRYGGRFRPRPTAVRGGRRGAIRR